MREIPTLPAGKTTRSARLSAIPVMPFPPPFGCGRFPPYLPAGDGERLALLGSILAGVTFTPEPNRPNFTSPGEKTNLTQKGPRYV